MKGHKQARRVTAEQAIGHIRSGNRISVPLGCGLPQTLMEAMVENANRLRNVEIVSGLQVKFPFLRKGLAHAFHFRTWQCIPSIRQHLKRGTVEYVPMRQGDVLRVFHKNGHWPVDIAMIQVSPPDKEGFCSLGVSIGHSLPMVSQADLVIAEVNAQMPRVLGDAFVHLSQIDLMVESDRQLIEYAQRESICEKEAVVGKLVAAMVPDGATVQIGIGAIPQVVLRHLTGKRDLRFYALGIDGIVDVVASGAVQEGDGPKVFVTEFLGTSKLFRFLHDNPLIEGAPLDRIINTLQIARIPLFHSVVSAIEMDLTGQLNAETVNGNQVSAIGGSIDYIEGACYSRGGKSIIAMTSTTPGETNSRIVPYLPLGSAVTTPRHAVQYVVTEYGVADLWGKTLKERARELIGIAHPKFRDALLKEARSRFFL